MEAPSRTCPPYPVYLPCPLPHLPRTPPPSTSPTSLLHCTPGPAPLFAPQWQVAAWQQQFVALMDSASQHIGGSLSQLAACTSELQVSCTPPVTPCTRPHTITHWLYICSHAAFAWCFFIYEFATVPRPHPSHRPYGHAVPQPCSHPAPPPP